MEKRFLYHGEAIAASGVIRLPFKEVIDIQASVALPMDGGYGSARVENFKYRELLSFGSAHSVVIGAYSEEDKAWQTLATTTIEKLDVMGVVTADRIVARITSKHPKNGDEPSIIPLGSSFENLRIAGVPVAVDLATDLFTKYGTFTGLQKAYSSDRKSLEPLLMVAPEGKALPQSKAGMAGVTLVRNCDYGDKTSVTKNAIKVDHFGTVYLAEMYVSGNERRLVMLRIELGCPVEGGVALGGVGGNGSPYP
jgi:hypothetical protein